MKETGYSKGYRHAHRERDAVTNMQCLPENLLGTIFYEPTERGFEQRIRERLEWLRSIKGTDGENKQQ
jgi:putative ATPase